MLGAAWLLSSAAGTARAAAGPWFWPVAASPGRVTPVVLRGFEPPARRWDAGHRGVDLAAPVGAPVRAAGAGTVTFAGPLFGRDVVAVSHGTLRTTYLPVLPSVRRGERVRGGEIIGTLAAASPPSSCDGARSCLHWGLVAGHGHTARYADPLALVGDDRVRLLPVWSGTALDVLPAGATAGRVLAADAAALVLTSGR